MFRNRLKNVAFGGWIISKNLLATASQLGVDFRHCEAVDISITPQYDMVMSESVFEYFQSLEYAQTVLEKMLSKSRKLVYIGGVWDEECKEELMGLRRKTIPDYDKRYEGLGKQFYRKEWIEKIAVKFGRKVVYGEVVNPEYWNADFLFNCFIV